MAQASFASSNYDALGKFGVHSRNKSFLPLLLCSPNFHVQHASMTVDDVRKGKRVRHSREGEREGNSQRQEGRLGTSQVRFPR